MTLEELHAIDQPHVQELIFRHLEDDPADFALRFHGQPLPVAAMATQLRIYQRAVQKLPTWVQHQCWFTARAYEQSTSELAARLKPLPAVRRVVDLTGGLGVDVWHLAQSCEEVLYVDADPFLCELAQMNFKRLGMDNVTVRNGRAEEVLLEAHELAFDLVVIDPDRRSSSGTRKTPLNAYSPDLTQLLPAYLQQFPQGPHPIFFLKLSPLLDLSALEAEFSPLGGSLQFHVVAVDGGVKEVLVEWNPNAPTPEKVSVALHLHRAGQDHHYTLPGISIAMDDLEMEELVGKMAFEPDNAAYHARVVGELCREELGIKGKMARADGYYFGEEWQGNFPGRVYRILDALPYKPKQLKKELKRRGWKKANLTRRGFDLSVQKIQAALRIETGGAHYLLFTRLGNGDRVTLLGERAPPP